MEILLAESSVTLFNTTIKDRLQLRFLPLHCIIAVLVAVVFPVFFFCQSVVFIALSF